MPVAMLLLEQSLILRLHRTRSLRTHQEGQSSVCTVFSDEGPFPCLTIVKPQEKFIYMVLGECIYSQGDGIMCGDACRRYWRFEQIMDEEENLELSEDNIETVSGLILSVSIPTTNFLQPYIADE